MKWDDKERKFRDELALNEFVSWLYPRSDEEGLTEVKGDWNQRVLKTRDDIRTVSYLITEASDLFQQFRNNKNLEVAYSLSLARKYEKQSKEQADPTAEVFEAIRNCSKILENVPFKMLRDEQIKQQLFNSLGNLQEAINSLREV